MARPGEFEVIARYFAPLAAATPGALGLTDDAALIAPSPGCRNVIAVDTLVAGVHFLEDDPADLVARKLLRVNLSDLAAMGAEPLGYLLAISLNEGVDEDWLESFAAGLAADQAEFGIGLLGGDTTSTPGPVTLSLTAVGEAPENAALLRSSARPGDVIHVSGTLGDAALGLEVLKGARDGLPDDVADALIDRYRLPRPRGALGVALRDIASAAVDVSDGLIADIGHICTASGVAARIERDRLPIGEAARAVLDLDPTAVEICLSGGDDYELVFTADPRAADAVAHAAREAGVPVTEIGRIEAGAAVTVVDDAGREVETGAGGYRHF